MQGSLPADNEPNALQDGGAPAVHNGIMESSLAQPIPPEATPSDPASAGSTPAELPLTKLTSPEPISAEVTLAEPVPAESTFPELVPAENTLPELTPVDSAPTEPTPAESNLAEPTPAEPSSEGMDDAGASLAVGPNAMLTTEVENSIPEIEPLQRKDDPTTAGVETQQQNSNAGCTPQASHAGLGNPSLVQPSEGKSDPEGKPTMYGAIKDPNERGFEALSSDAQRPLPQAGIPENSGGVEPNSKGGIVMSGPTEEASDSAAPLAEPSSKGGIEMSHPTEQASDNDAPLDQIAEAGRSRNGRATSLSLEESILTGSDLNGNADLRDPPLGAESAVSGAVAGGTSSSQVEEQVGFL